jgi:NDP-sugar pyrophosphorylase family protein
MGLQISDVPAAILAGGLATRLGSLTGGRPKALVDVAGRPFVDHQLDLLSRHGIRRVVFCVGHFGEQIEAHLGSGADRGLSIGYVYDGDQLLGTAGAIRRALPLLGDRFWVMYGDSYMDIDYAAVLAEFDRRGRPALMTVIRNDDRWDRSNAEYRGGRLLAYDKRRPTSEMRHIDYGVALLEREVVGAHVPAGVPHDLADLYQQLVADGTMIGYEVTERFYEIGSPAGLEETRRHLMGLSGARS